MDVILIQPRLYLGKEASRREMYHTLPLGLLSIAAPLDKAGYQVRIIDQRLDDNWEQHLIEALKSGPVCAGITVMTGPQISWAIRASEVIKNNSDVPVVWGGVHPTILPEQTIAHPLVDIIVRGEGEETFYELVASLAARRSISGIRGITYRNGTQTVHNEARPFINMDNQPLPSYHLVDVNRYLTSINGHLCLPIETSRGCSFKCAFCYNNSFHHNKWRAYSSERVLDHIDYVVKNFGVKGICFRDDNFFSGPDRAKSILEGLIKRHPELVWGKGDIRLDMLDRLDDRYFRMIEKSNCINLIIGIESGSQRIADLIRKEIDVSRAPEINRRLARFKMALYYLFLTGIPGETLEDLTATTHLMLKLTGDNPRAANGTQIFIPYPGTELYQKALENGLQPPQKLEEWIPMGWINRNFDYPWITPRQKKLICALSFCSIFIGGARTLRTWSELSPVLSIIADLYSPVARFRLKGGYYSHLPELKAAQVLGYRGY